MTCDIKRPIVTGLTVLLGVTGLGTLAAPARTQKPKFRLFASHSGKALTTGSLEIGTVVFQKTSSNGPNEVWFFNSDGQLVHNQSGLCMEPESLTSGARIGLQQCYTGDPTAANQPPQFWTLRLTTINDQRLARYQNKMTNLVLDVSNASTSNGANLVQFSITGGQNQSFERRFL